MIAFESLDVGSSLSLIRYISGIWVKFVYEGYWVKVRVMGSNKVQYPYFCNVKLTVSITAFLHV